MFKGELWSKLRVWRCNGAVRQNRCAKDTSVKIRVFGMKMGLLG